MINKFFDFQKGRILKPVNIRELVDEDILSEAISRKKEKKNT